MEFRGHDELMAVSPTPRKHGYELGPEQFPSSRGNASDGDGSPRGGIWRSSSPQRGAHRPRRVLVRDRRSGSVERRGQYVLHIGGGGAGWTDKVYSPSPPLHQVEKRPHFDDEIVHRNYQLSRHIHFDANDDSTRLKQVYGYDHDISRMSKEKDYSENRITQRTMPVEDGAVRKSYQMPPDLGQSSNYLETGEHFPLSSHSMDIGQVDHEKLQHLDNLPVPYKAEKPVLRSRDDSCTMVPATYSKDFANSCFGISGDEVMDAYQDGLNLWHSEEFPCSGKIREPVGAYGRRSGLDSGIDPEVRLQKGAYSPTRVEREDYFFPKSRRITNDDHGYQSGTISRTMPSHSQLDYDHRLMDYDHRDVSRSTIMHPVLERGKTDEDPCGNLGGSRIWDHHSLQKPSVPDYLDITRTSNASKHRDEYLGSGSSHVDYRRVSRDHEMLHDRQVTYLRPDQGFARDASPGNQKERPLRGVSPMSCYEAGNHRLAIRTHRMEEEEFGTYETADGVLKRKYRTEKDIRRHDSRKSKESTYLRPDQSFARDASPGNQKERPLRVSPISFYEAETHMHAIRTQRMEEEEFGTYETADRVLKRKYRTEKDIRRHDSRSLMSSKWNDPREYEDLRDVDEYWTNEDMSERYPYRPVEFDYNDCREPERTYDRHRHNHIDYASDDLPPPSRFSSEHSKRHSIQSYKHGNDNTYAEGHSRPRSNSCYDSNNFNRTGYRKRHNVWKRIDGYHDGEHVNGSEPSNLQENAARSEPSDEAEEFVKLVDEAFLKYSKKLNMNPAVRRRYLEQGKAGSLFCIVCGRSFSKEFINTQRLGTHAFMSHKAGLRIEHLGLLKAICVLLGWNKIVAPGTITWTPEVLPDAEALAQKEDLILWPPLVIVHNIASAEGLEAFLRGTGFVGGKFKVCQGNPPDESIMVVKFSGTFTGLENAERLHKYFADDKHGRVDFDHMPTSRAGKTGNKRGEDKAKELVLYGYMGIVEDLDKLDYNTKMSSWVKSKDEILNLANAPVK